MKPIIFAIISSVFFTILFISGCTDQKVSIYTICNEQSEICDDIDSEGWCKYDRAELITRRYKAIQAPTDQDNQYRTLLAWLNFNKCIKVASNITRKTVEARSQAKTNAYLVSIREIERLEQQTLKSELPQLLYYHWVRVGDPDRINALLRLDQQNKLATTELQLMMASYYAKVDRVKETKAHYRALNYLGNDHVQKIDNQIYASLATNFFSTKDYSLAYIWTKVAQRSGLKLNNLPSLQRELVVGSSDTKRLDAIADKTFQSITAREFISPDSQI